MCYLLSCYRRRSNKRFQRSAGGSTATAFTKVMLMLISTKNNQPPGRQAQSK